MHGSTSMAHERRKLELIEGYNQLRKTFVDYDLTIEREDWQPRVIHERYWNWFDISSLRNKLAAYTDLNINTAIERFTYLNYLNDIRYKSNLFAKLPELDNSTSLLVFFPRYYNAFSLTEDIERLYPLKSIPPNMIEQSIDLLQYFFEKYWPDYYMKFTPHGSIISGLGFTNSHININIELDEPDLRRIVDIKHAYIKDTPSPFCVETSSKFLHLYGAEKILYESDIDSVRFKLGAHSIEYTFNNELVTISTNLIQHYMALDPRVAPFLAALKVFGRGRNIFASQIKEGVRYYGYTILALAYLSQLDPPVIPNLQHINYNGTEDTCNSETCSSKKKYWGTANFQGQNVGIATRYHDCVEYNPDIDKTERYVQQDPITGKSYWNSKNKSTVGHLFLDFLHYYGYRFNFKKYAVSLKFGGMIVKKPNWKHHEIAIEDPFMAYTNLASMVTSGEKFVDLFKGSFSVLHSGICFEMLHKKIPEITKIDKLRGVGNDRPFHIPLPNQIQKFTSKSFILIGLPKSGEDICYCERITNLFTTHGKIEKMIDLDSETKQVFFTPDSGSANDILLPSSFVLNGQNVYLVELYNFNI